LIVLDSLIGTSTPVLGFLPILSGLFLISKIPKPEIFISSPSANLFLIEDKTKSTALF